MDRRASRFAGVVAAVTAVGLFPAVSLAALQARGDLAPEPNGYPFTYQDFTGLTLGMCTDPAFCPAPVSQTGNQDGFEGFYWILGSPAGALGNAAFWEAALEAATFDNGVGGVDRNVFFRIRFRMDVTVPGEYVLRHPFGEKKYTASAGTRGINDTIDLGVVPNNFDAVLPVFGGPATPDFPNGGQFITWDATDPPPPAGYAGNFNVPHTITAGPSGFSSVIIEGPNDAFGPGVSTTQTSLFHVGARIQGDAPPHVYTAHKTEPLKATRISGEVTKVLEYVDPNGGTQTVELTPLPSFCTSVSAPNKVTIACTPAATDPQAITSVTLTVRDDSLPTPLQDSVSFNVVVDNVAPTVAPIPPTTVVNDSTAKVVVPVTVNDPDGNGIVSIAATLTPTPSDPRWFKFTRTGATTGEIVIQGPIPVVDGNKVYSVDIHVSDDGSPTRLTEASASLQVNNSPTVIVNETGGGCSTGGGVGGLGLVLALVPLALRRRR